MQPFIIFGQQCQAPAMCSRLIVQSLHATVLYFHSACIVRGASLNTYICSVRTPACEVHNISSQNSAHEFMQPNMLRIARTQQTLSCSTTQYTHLQTALPPYPIVSHALRAMMPSTWRRTRGVDCSASQLAQAAAARSHSSLLLLWNCASPPHLPISAKMSIKIAHWLVLWAWIAKSGQRF